MDPSMDSEVPAPLVDKVNVIMETSRDRSLPSKKNHVKVPKRIHKSEREKLKREHLNELFLDLANAIDLSNQNNGKAFILNEATRLLKDMLAQVECLKRENATLLSESQYVTMEKNELRDENSALGSQIEKLRSEMEVSVAQPKPDLNVAPEFHNPETTPHLVEDCIGLPTLEPSLQQAPVVGPVYVIQAYGEPDTVHLASKPMSNVSKPHARYPTPTDSWPSQLLGKQPQAREELLVNGSNAISTRIVG
ncbi:transcription factor bHLH47-like [Malania oleifera]|uniref:transcription factor bHLH47-like n=1 Tax=Malania oleifera TaxID=397392 RepID=UPI0025AE13AD|nr:transcription factor bHLH47-like [Malania oleifera]